MIKTLTIDIETSPNLAHVWGIWQQNIGLPQLLEATEVLCAASKWYGEDETLFVGQNALSKEGMLEVIWGWLDEADAVVSYNGARFDIPHLNREFLELGVLPPSPYKQIDLLKTAKSKFRFPSNKLDYISQKLGIGQKVEHAGHKLWVDCMVGDADAWATMELYNREDAVLTEKLYDRFKPWIQPHPNTALYQEDSSTLCCPLCGRSDNLHPRGYAYTAVSKYQRYLCGCGKWMRGKNNLADRTTKGVSIV